MVMFNKEKLYEKIGYNEEVISKGRYAEMRTAERSLRPDEEKLFAERVQNVYKEFRDKAASSRSMSVDEMEKIAQGRVWTGNDAASRGLVDAIRGFSQAIAKHKANIPQNKRVTLVELSKPSLSLQKFMFSMLSLTTGIDKALKHLQDDLATHDGVQARVDGPMFDRSEGSSFGLLKDYLNSL
ncbi:serine protease SPPA, chloroplastic-like [Bidens hawaiensis]|uniref:serine protease SPPA, chloroplastic-like n=1 Tax=Bidens hawaiensis TaxID=980011 RepID=UPI00404A9444